MDQLFTRRRLIRTSALTAAAAVSSLPLFARAQDEEDEETDQQVIQSTRRGEMPTTGGVRPGPANANPQPLSAEGAVPALIEIPAIEVSAQVETLEIENGVLQNPTGPWVVSWYRETARAGAPGNCVMAGHVDYWNVGPSVFYSIKTLQKGDKVEVTGDNGQVYAYEVAWSKLFDEANSSVADIVGGGDLSELTLITCGGPFDYENGVYLQRTVVRATLVIE